jgi:hypothetical protein
MPNVVPFHVRGNALATHDPGVASAEAYARGAQSPTVKGAAVAEQLPGRCCWSLPR